MRRRFGCVGSPQAKPNGFGRTLGRQLAFDGAAGQANRAENYGFATICHQNRQRPPTVGRAGDFAKKRETPTPKPPAPQAMIGGASWPGFSSSRGSR